MDKRRTRKKGTIVAQNYEHTLFKQFNGRVVTKDYLITKMNKGHKYYDLKGGEITYASRDNHTFLRTVGNRSHSDNLINVPETKLHLANVPEMELQLSKHFSRKKGTIVAQNYEHTLFKQFNGRVVTKDYLITKMNKGHKYYDLKGGEITYASRDNHTFLRTIGDRSRSNNLTNVPETKLYLTNVFKTKLQLSKRFFIRQTTNKKKLLTILSIGLIICGISISIPFLTTLCSKKPTTLNGYNWDGTNWSGYVSGKLKLKDLGNKQAEIEANNSYIANNLIIPDEVVKGRTIYKITSIGVSAFQSSTGLTGSLTIGNSVTSIGISAFLNCSGLNGTLILGNNLTIIGDYAFQNCTNLVGSLIIPNSVTSIGSYAFNNCFSLTGSLTISNNLINLNIGVFRECSGLTGNLIIPDSVISIGADCFKECIGFNGTLELTNNLEEIGEEAFRECINLTGDLTIHGTSRVSNLAFEECPGFTSLTFDNFENDPPWEGEDIFGRWNTSGGTVTVTGAFTSTWTENDALMFALHKGLNSSWHN